eukprot:Amastigsp_a843345_80.p3 type:complete len:137 gc:universal Amastigsp_a843345_80:449-39(-)
MAEALALAVRPRSLFSSSGLCAPSAPRSVRSRSLSTCQRARCSSTSWCSQLLRRLAPWGSRGFYTHRSFSASPTTSSTTPSAISLRASALRSASLRLFFRCSPRVSSCWREPVCNFARRRCGPWGMIRSETARFFD